MKKLILVLFSLCSFSSMAFDIKGLKVDKPIDCAVIKSLETRNGTFILRVKKEKKIGM